MNLLDLSLGMGLSAWVLTGGLMALWQLNQTAQRVALMHEWTSADGFMQRQIRQRLQRVGAPLIMRIGPGEWTLQAMDSPLSADDPRKGPWRLTHFTANTALNCQGGAVEESQHQDTLSLATPDRLMCQNPIHSGNVRQTLWGGVRAWQWQVAVRVSSSPETWQWQLLSATQGLAPVLATRLCWRTVPEHPLVMPLANVAPAGPPCEWPGLSEAHRDTWQLTPHWHPAAAPS